MIDPRAWDVPCPVCGVGAGSSCRNALGVVLGVVHLLRMYAAQEAEGKEPDHDE